MAPRRAHGVLINDLFRNDRNSGDHKRWPSRRRDRSSTENRVKGVPGNACRD